MCLETMDDCSTNCNGNGECFSGHCHCFPGFLGPDCARGTVFHLCKCWTGTGRAPVMLLVYSLWVEHGLWTVGNKSRTAAVGHTGAFECYCPWSWTIPCQTYLIRSCKKNSYMILTCFHAPLQSWSVMIDKQLLNPKFIRTWLIKIPPLI